MGPAVIPIACRFGKPIHLLPASIPAYYSSAVHCDQWLVTHFDPTWKIVQVKLWILAKCMPTHAKDIDAPRYRPASPITFAPDPQDRPISPITFAPPAYAKGPFEGTFGYGVDDELDDPFYDSSSLLDYNTATRQRHQRRNPSLSIRTNQPPQPEQSPPPDTQFSSQFTLIRFSTGQILEDDFTLEWYSLAPYELIEIHRNGMILRLPRASVPEYAAPYFEAKVLALRVVGTDYRSGEGKGKGKSTAIHDSHMRKRKAQLQWAERWLVIREGVFKLCKDCSVSFSGL